METSNLDTPEDLPSLFLVMELKVDSFAEENPTQEQIDALGRELARMWTGQIMTKKAIVSYKSTPLSKFVWLRPDQLPQE
jgi:hypothetical protein